MKINQGVDTAQPLASQATGAKGSSRDAAAPKANPDAAAATPAAQSGSLNISQLSARLQSLESKLAGGGSFDAARVSEIRQSIQDGSFKVDSEAVADKLISGAHDLFIRRH